MDEENHAPPEVPNNQEENDEFDASKILEMAKLFSTLMSNDNNDNDDHKDDSDEVKDEAKISNEDSKSDSSNNIFQMLEMAKLFSSLMGNGNTKASPQEAPPPIVPQAPPVVYSPSSILFDESIHTPQMKVIKAAIPYMDPSQQKILGIFVKSLELKRVMDVYRTNDNPLSATSVSSNPHWKMDMLNSIRPHCSEEKQCLVDMMTRVMDIGELMKKMNTLKSNQAPKVESNSNKPDQKQTLINALSPMLNDNQKQMLNMLTTLMGNM